MVTESQADEEDNEADEGELNAVDLENIAILYDSIRRVRRRVEKNMDKTLAENFDSHLKRVMMELSQKLQVITEDSPIRVSTILVTKKNLLDICFEKANEYLEKTDEPVS